MSHPKKKQKLTEADANSVPMAAASVGDVSIDVLADILGFLDGPNDIMQKRRVCKKWKEAVKKTIPPADFRINSSVKYNAVNVMTRAMPNLEQIDIYGFEQTQRNELFIDANGNLGYGHKYNDGEDPDEELAAETADYRAHDIEIFSSFTKLRILTIFLTRTSLNGRYPVLFNSFPLLEKLIIMHCPSLKWDLEMLAGMPLLKELYCVDSHLTGNISCLRVLKGSLEKVEIPGCHNVEGNFMDLADFPYLKKLDLGLTDVTGDIRDIGENGFSSLEYLCWMPCLNLPRKVYGGRGYQFQRISDGPDLIRLLYRLKKQRPVLLNMYACLPEYAWYGMISGDSPDLYEGEFHGDDTPPFYIYFVKAGCRVGYRWQTQGGKPCEVNWLDPEPDRESSDYEKYMEDLQEIERDVAMSIYKGFRQPPTEEEYHRLFEDYAERHET
jgi:hypothetical protein